MKAIGNIWMRKRMAKMVGAILFGNDFDQKELNGRDGRNIFLL
jgi:hypothetical protein